MVKKKVLAYWSVVCPGCNIGRKFPESFIGKRVVEHWEEGCAVHEAYEEIFGKKEEENEKDSEKAEGERS
jgi:hypothetical protein